VQDHYPADCKAKDGAEGGNQQAAGVEMKDIGEDGGQSKNQADRIKPQRSANRSTQVIAQTQLKEQCSEADRSYNYERHGTEEGGAAGVENDQGQSEQEEARGDDGPSPWLGRSDRTGLELGQGFRPSYTGRNRGIQMVGRRGMVGERAARAERRMGGAWARSPAAACHSAARGSPLLMA